MRNNHEYLGAAQIDHHIKNMDLIAINKIRNFMSIENLFIQKKILVQPVIVALSRKRKLFSSEVMKTTIEAL